MKLTIPAAVLAAAFCLNALAGECPADKMTPDGAGQKPYPTAPQGVTDRLLASNDLSQDSIALKGRLFRTRELVVAPGWVVPWHDHGDRPAMIYIVSGHVTEYASTCAVPIQHKAGEVPAEKAPTMHWWKNNGKVKAAIISVDLFPTEMKMDDHMM